MTVVINFCCDVINQSARAARHAALRRRAWRHLEGTRTKLLPPGKLPLLGAAATLLLALLHGAGNNMSNSALRCQSGMDEG